MENEQQETIHKLQLTSDIFFSLVLEDIAACQEVVRIITGEEITIVDVSKEQKKMHLMA